MLVPVSFSGCSLGTYRFNFSFTGTVGSRIILLRTCFDPVCIPAVPCKASGFGFRVRERRSMGDVVRAIRGRLGGLSSAVGGGIRSKRFPGVGCAYVLHSNVPRRRVLQCTGRCGPRVVVVKAEKEDRGSVSLVNDIATRIVREDGSFMCTVPRRAPLGAFGSVGGMTFIAGFSRESLVTFSSLVGTFGSFRFTISFVRLDASGST